jgi:hypothetical protein
MYDRALAIFPPRPYSILSGSVGDWWSGGKFSEAPTTDWRSALSLFFNHGIAIPERFIKVRPDESYNESNVTPYLSLLRESSLFRTIFGKRGRVGLASFIVRVAERYSSTFTPFYDFDVALSQLCLPPSEREGRKWQKDYFKVAGILLDDSKNGDISVSSDNSQDFQAAVMAIKNGCLLELDDTLFSEIVDPLRISWINSTLRSLHQVPLADLRKLASLIYAIEPMQANVAGAGRSFDIAFQHAYSVDNSHAAIREWMVLAPLQLAIFKHQRGTS